MSVPEPARQVHAELKAHEPAIENVVRILVGLDDRLQKALALVEVFGDAPLLEADHHHLDRIGPLLAVLHDVHVAAAVALDGLAGQRVRDPSDVDEGDLAKEPRRVEEEALHAVVTHREELRILRPRRLVVDLVEDHLALVDARAGKPLDLTVELGRDAGDELLLLHGGFVRFFRDRMAHRIAPLEVDDCLVPQFRRIDHAPVERDFPARGLERGVIQLVRLQFLERLLDFNRRRGREKVHLGESDAVALLESRDDLNDLAAERVRRQALDLVVAARRNVARTGRAVVVVDRTLPQRDLRLFDELRHVVLRNRLTGHAPVLAALAQGGAHLGRARVQKTNHALGDELLQFLVRPEREVHAVGIRTDQHKILREDEIDGFRHFGVLLDHCHRRLSVLRALRVDLLDPHEALHRMHALLRHQSRRLEENRPDAAQEVPVRILRKYPLSNDLHG